MSRILTVLTLVVASLLMSVGSANAGTLERQTRRSAGIPAAAVERVPEYDRFIRGTQFRPEGTHCYTSRTIKPVRVLGRVVQKNRLLQYCTDRYVDERRPARTFVRYLRAAQNNAAEQAEADRLVRLCESLGGTYDFPGGGGGCYVDGVYTPLAGL